MAAIGEQKNDNSDETRDSIFFARTFNRVFFVREYIMKGLLCAILIVVVIFFAAAIIWCNDNDDNNVNGGVESLCSAGDADILGTLPHELNPCIGVRPYTITLPNNSDDTPYYSYETVKNELLKIWPTYNNDTSAAYDDCHKYAHSCPFTTHDKVDYNTRCSDSYYDTYPNSDELLRMSVYHISQGEDPAVSSSARDDIVKIAGQRLVVPATTGGNSSALAVSNSANPDIVSSNTVASENMTVTNYIGGDTNRDSVIYTTFAGPQQRAGYGLVGGALKCIYGKCGAEYQSSLGTRNPVTYMKPNQARDVSTIPCGSDAAVLKLLYAETAGLYVDAPPAADACEYVSNNTIIQEPCIYGQTTARIY